MKQEQEKWKGPSHHKNHEFGSSVAIFLVWYTILEGNNNYLFSILFNLLCCAKIKKNKGSYVLANNLGSAW